MVVFHFVSLYFFDTVLTVTICVFIFYFCGFGIGQFSFFYPQFAGLQDLN
jgi:hypothetical protein